MSTQLRYRPSRSASGSSPAPFRPAGRAGRRPAPRWSPRSSHSRNGSCRLLNGSHSMLAYAGSIRGHQTIDEAIADPACRSWVETFWDEASRHLDLAGLRHHELSRRPADPFSNPRMSDQLARIAADGSSEAPGTHPADHCAQNEPPGRVPTAAPPPLPPGCCTCAGSAPRSKTQEPPQRGGSLRQRPRRSGAGRAEPAGEGPDPIRAGRDRRGAQPARRRRDQ